VAGAVQVSRTTASRLADGRYELRSRGLIEIKGKDPMEAIIVSWKDRPTESIDEVRPAVRT
jgi:hypothetical protein